MKSNDSRRRLIARAVGIFSILAGLTAASGPAGAQSFPAPTSDRWVAFPCGNGPMVDGVRDHLAAVDERDVVGNGADPAGFRAVDADFLYLRLRVEEDPLLGGKLRRFAWGFAFSVAAILSPPEILVTVDGTTEEVAVYRNSTVSVLASPTDPADQPPVARHPFATHGRVVAAAGSNFGGDGDYFIDLAVPWTALRPLGFTPEQAVYVWAASSSAGDRLDGDFACHDSAGGSNPPDLDDAASSRTSASAGAPPGGGAGGSGGGPVGPSGPNLEGGPNCRFGPGGRVTGAGAATILLSLAALAGLVIVAAVRGRWARSRRR